MANLQVRDIDERLYEALRERAAQERRSISQEVILILERHLSEPISSSSNPTDEFLQLAGAWHDDRAAAEIVQDLRDARPQSTRFSASADVFD